MRNISLSLLLVLLLVACGNGIPTEYKKSNSLPTIYPDYCGVTVPVNIAPLNFQSDSTASIPMVARFTTANEQIVVCGHQIQIDPHDWRALVADAVGKAIKVGSLQFDGLKIATSPEVVVCSVKATRASRAAAAAEAAQ